MHRVLYRLIAALARLAVRSGHSKDLEIIVLRHQLGVLRRPAERPAITNRDRTLLGAIGAAPPARNGTDGSSHPTLFSVGIDAEWPATGLNLTDHEDDRLPPPTSAS